MAKSCATCWLEMTEFVYFLGRFHVLVLHLPIGILTLAVVLEGLVRLKRFRWLEPLLLPLWLAGSLTAIVTAALGLMHASESSFQDLPAVDAHRTAGFMLVVAACIVAVLRLRLGPAPAAAWPKWAARERLAPLYEKHRGVFAPGGPIDRLYARAWPIAAGLVLVMLFATGHLGGNLTHGDAYLVEYAPAPIRRLAGLPLESEPRAKPKDLASADIYLDIVAPALRQRCTGCHNNSKRSGRLSLATYADVMRGGEHGPVIVAGDPAKSDLLRRISLPSDDKDFMPKEGKPPLTQQQAAAISWWISQGAPKSAAVGGLTMTAEVEPALKQILGFSPESETTGLEGRDEIANLPAAPPADANTIAELESAGFIIRPVAETSNLLDVSYSLPRPVADADLAKAATLSQQIFRLNLRSAGVTDAQLDLIASLQVLSHLRLENNPITDAGVSRLTVLKSLSYLNLFGTRISDRGLASLGSLENLRAVYVWQTAVTDAGVTAFRASHPGVLVNTGVKPGDIVKETEILLPR
jgi:hypothetical protein